MLSKVTTEVNYNAKSDCSDCLQHPENHPGHVANGYKYVKENVIYQYLTVDLKHKVVNGNHLFFRYSR